LLSIQNVTCGYVGGINILENLSLDIPEKAITGVIGPNGAGKSTLLKTIFNFLHLSTGKIVFEGQEITHYSPYRLKQMGISYMLQEFSTFPQLTVRDNLLLGGWTIRKDRKLLNKRLEEVFHFFPMLRERQKEKANYLSGGLLRMLSLGKEIITKPRLFLIDEPSAGLAPLIVKEIYSFLKNISREGTSILLVDQNINKAIEVSDYMYLLEMGKIKQRGHKDEFKKNIRQIIRDSMIST
jgi:ABC-type branched-subunit amino acid transport system ATPase component